MEIRAERAILPAVEALGTVVLLREELEGMDITKCILNVRDCEAGKPGTVGIQLIAPFGRGLKLTLQDSPTGRLYNCILRGIEKDLNGKRVMEQLDARLIRIRSEEWFHIRTIRLLRKKFPEGIMRNSDIRTTAMECRGSASLSRQFTHYLVRQLYVVPLPREEYYGLVPQGESAMEWRRRYGRIMQLQEELGRVDIRGDALSDDEAWLARFDAEMTQLQERRAEVALRIEQARREYQMNDQTAAARTELAELLALAREKTK